MEALHFIQLNNRNTIYALHFIQLSNRNTIEALPFIQLSKIDTIEALHFIQFSNRDTPVFVITVINSSFSHVINFYNFNTHISVISPDDHHALVC